MTNEIGQISEAETSRTRTNGSRAGRASEHGRGETEKDVERTGNGSDDDENNENNKPNATIYIPTNKVKLFLGASGESVSECENRTLSGGIGIRKKAKEMYEGFSGQNVVLIDGDENDENEKDDAKTCVELYGDDEAVQMFKLLLEDLFARAKKMKTESRKQDRDRQRKRSTREALISLTARRRLRTFRCHTGRPPEE